MQRWTVRNVDPEAVNAIREICAETGASLGALLSAAIHHGKAAARQTFVTRAEFDDKSSASGSQPRDSRSPLDRIFDAQRHRNAAAGK